MKSILVLIAMILIPAVHNGSTENISHRSNNNIKHQLFYVNVEEDTNDFSIKKYEHNYKELKKFSSEFNERTKNLKESIQ